MIRIRLLAIPLLITSCAPRATPEKALITAQQYAELEWLPETQHVRHGRDSKGIMVHTPDRGLKQHGDSRGFWEPGKIARGMAYKWGGFDTPASFLKGLGQGKKAGDVANSYKVKHDNLAVSEESVGIDCSGFISRCWGLDQPLSTRDLPSICDPLASWDELRMGDILLKSGHVLMFVGRQDGWIIGYEAGPIPTWRARRCAIPIRFLKENDYAPWRYREMAAPKPATQPRYDIDISKFRWTTGPY